MNAAIRPARLWHFTCRGSVAGIDRDGELRPHPHPWLPEPLVWLTDLDTPIRVALGLAAHITACDRTEHRYEAADTTTAQHWPRYARGRIPAHIRRAFECGPGAMPAHWWVSTAPVPVKPATR